MNEFKKYTDINQVKNEDCKKYMGHVYLFNLSNGTTKIGKTKSPYDRLNTLYRTLVKYNPDVELVSIYLSPEHTNYSENEALLHKLFESTRIDGTELFTSPIEKILGTAKGLGFQDKTDEITEHSEQSAEDFKREMNRIFGYIDILEVQENGWADNFDNFTKHLITSTIKNSTELLQLYINFIDSDSVTDKYQIQTTTDIMEKMLNAIKCFIEDEKVVSQLEGMIATIIKLSDMACEVNEDRLLALPTID